VRTKTVMTKKWATAVVALLSLAVLGCGELRYSEVSPDARNFHPRRVAILPADATAFAAAKGDIDRLFAEALRDQNWFAGVVGGDEIGRRLESDEAFGKIVRDNIAWFANFSFFDPGLSGKLGEMAGAEAFITVRVDYWNYTTLDDERVAKVSLTVTLVEAKTGKTIWTARHHKISGAKIFKPALSGVARSLIREMVGYMPH
jgi:hypothetical protein